MSGPASSPAGFLASARHGSGIALQTPYMRRRFDLTPLGHPAWWGALALLLINDNLLKGRGVVPGWLTGKLSDFAFLIVAPVLFAAIIPRRVPGRRTFAVASVVALYVAADLSRAVSDAVVAAAARVGLHWRLWPDPTDLLALAVLPATVWLLRRPPKPAPTARSPAGWACSASGPGIVLGALACLATSAPPTYPHNPFLFNRTTTATDVRITWVLRKVDCNTTPDVLGAMLGPSDLDDPRALTLQTGDVAALDGVPPAGMSPVGVCSTTRPASSYSYGYGSGQYECVAAILETPGATPVLMVTPRQWDASASGDFISCCDSSNPNSRCSPKLDTHRNPGDEALSITNSGGTLRFDVTHTGPHEEGPVGDTPIRDRAHRSSGDRGAPAGRGRLPRVARQVPRAGRHRDGMHRRRRLSVAAGADAAGRRPDVRGVREPQCVRVGPPIRRDAALRHVPDHLRLLRRAAAGDLPRGPLRRAVRGREPAGLPGGCSNYATYPDGICDLYSGSCLGNDGFICTCQDHKYSCGPMPQVDPDLPAGVSAAQSTGDADLRCRRARRIRGGRRWWRRRRGDGRRGRDRRRRHERRGRRRRPGLAGSRSADRTGKTWHKIRGWLRGARPCSCAPSDPRRRDGQPPGARRGRRTVGAGVHRRPRRCQPRRRVARHRRSVRQRQPRLPQPAAAARLLRRRPPARQVRPGRVRLRALAHAAGAGRLEHAARRAPLLRGDDLVPAPLRRRASPGPAARSCSSARPRSARPCG